LKEDIHLIEQTIERKSNAVRRAMKNCNQKFKKAEKNLLILASPQQMKRADLINDAMKLN